MARYIDAAEFWNNRPENLDPKKSEYNRGWDDYANEILKVLKDTPTADVVEVVRCKDCAKDGLSTCPICYIEKQALIFINHNPDFYCAYGERRGENAT